MADLADFYDENFDDSAIEASKGFDASPLPNGEYLLQVENQEIVPTKDQTGVILKLRYGVVDGEFEGRKVFANFNIRNKSAQAQAIAIGEFKALCIATGLDYEHVKRDTELLDHVPFRAMVGLEKAQEGYAPRNRVTRYIPSDRIAPASRPAPQQAPAAQRQAPATKPAATGRAVPWAKTA